mmetsp:Transcript_29650/g.62450  ORF Transcript_29650/g.62450 Transcript_29650/m.62450 type:complete len:336 (-) Transcript_29650:71-1078(-)
MTRRYITWHTAALLQLLSFNNQNYIWCDAQLLSAYEQAYGSWDMKLSRNVFGRRRWHMEMIDHERGKTLSKGRKRDRRGKKDNDLQLLFPEAQIKRHDTTNRNDGEDEKRYEQVPTTTKSVRSVSCILNLERNGKFSLSLVGDEKGSQNDSLDNQHHDDPSDASPSLRTESNPTSLISHQPLQGEWYLTPNPYCVTDRHFDTLLLVSEPRMRRRSKKIVEKATVELRCKIWGRYGAGAVRKMMGLQHGRVKGRMTHGTLMIVKEQQVNGKKALPTREVVGTFRGRTIVDLDSVNALKELPAADDEEDDDDDDDDDDLIFHDNFDEFGVLRPITDD